MRRFLSYLKGLTSSNAEDSSKRFIAMYIFVGLVSFIVIAYTSTRNIELILGELCATGLLLLGVSSWEKRNKDKYGKDGGNQDQGN